MSMSMSMSMYMSMFASMFMFMLFMNMDVNMNVYMDMNVSRLGCGQRRHRQWQGHGNERTKHGHVQGHGNTHGHVKTIYHMTKKLLISDIRLIRYLINPESE